MKRVILSYFRLLYYNLWKKEIKHAQNTLSNLFKNIQKNMIYMYLFFPSIRTRRDLSELRPEMESIWLS